MIGTNGTAKLLTPSQVGLRLGINRHAVREYADKGLFPNAQRTPGGHLRIPAGDVDAFLAAQRQTSNPSPASDEAGNATASQPTG